MNRDVYAGDMCYERPQNSFAWLTWVQKHETLQGRLEAAERIIKHIFREK